MIKENRQVSGLKYIQKYEGQLSLVDSHRIARIAKILAQKSKGGKLLDLGCWEGSMTVVLRDMVEASETYGIELIEERVEESTQKGIKTIQLDLDAIDRLPYDNNFFDVIHCGELLEHLSNPDHLLDEIYRVLKQDGIAIISTPNLAAWYERIGILLGYQPLCYCTSFRHTLISRVISPEKLEVFSEPMLDHVRVMTFRTLKMMLLAHHFKIKYIVGSYGDAFLFPKSLKLLYKIVGGVLNTPSLAANVMIAVGK